MKKIVFILVRLIALSFVSIAIARSPKSNVNEASASGVTFYLNIPCFSCHTTMSVRFESHIGSNTFAKCPNSSCGKTWKIDYESYGPGEMPRFRKVEEVK